MKSIEFDAEIVGTGIEDGNRFVILNHTEFYPDGKGGQLGDRGKIGPATVIMVIERDHTVLHYVDTSLDFSRVHCIIDSQRRFDNSVQHTAQHILSQAFVSLYDIETVGFHMGEEVSTIDLDSFDITEEMIEEVERLSNGIVFEDRRVKKYTVEDEEIERLNLRKKENIKGKIKIVEIEGFDCSMCGGTHVNSTGAIGLVKVIKQEKVKKTLTRLTFVAGFRALRDYHTRVKIINSISCLLTTGEEELIRKIEILLEENGELRKNNKVTMKKLLDYIEKELLQNKESVGQFSFIREELPSLKKDELSYIGNLLACEPNTFSLIYNKEVGLLILGTDIPCDFLLNIKEKFFFNLRSWTDKNFLFFEFKDKSFLEDLSSLIRLNLTGLNKNQE